MRFPKEIFKDILGFMFKYRKCGHCYAIKNDHYYNVYRTHIEYHKDDPTRAVSFYELRRIIRSKVVMNGHS